MSLAKQAMKLSGNSPLTLMKRNKMGWPHVGFIPGPWGGCSHVLNRAPMRRMDFKVKILLGAVYTLSFFTYPWYVTYKMYDWDRLDENM